MQITRRFQSLVLVVLGLIAVTPAWADEAVYTNPILPGSHPDPSLCRVGTDYYLVNSTFELFPALPVHHSRDLVNWRLIGHGLHRPEQAMGEVNLLDVQSDGGIHAPTLRCRDGKFYIITTNVYQPPEEGAATEFVNFVLTADDPAGPWSMPIVVDGAPGIDPDLFFDDDGRVWYLGTRVPDDPTFDGEGQIWIQELDPESWQFIGERIDLWRGACGGVWAEGPHLYKRDGRYYLLIAEGGTSYNHAVMVALSDKVTGPYTSNPRNPILTTRHLSYDHWVNSTGHGDLVELPDGRWMMALLGIRNDIEGRSNMGRETHLVPVRWETEPFEWKQSKDTWPVAAPDTGRVTRQAPAPLGVAGPAAPAAFWDTFDEASLGLPWTHRRVPIDGAFDAAERPGFLRIKAGPAVIAPRQRANFVGVRQEQSVFAADLTMSFDPAGANEEAGLAIVQKDDTYITLTVLGAGEGDPLVRVTVKEPGAAARTVQQRRLASYDGTITLRIDGDTDAYRYSYSLGPAATLTPLAETPPDLVVSRGYTGTLIGPYATGNGRDLGGFVDIDQMDIRYGDSPGR